jgi:hypothetical protein
MPPKKVQASAASPVLPLTIPEQLMLRVASRVYTACKYKDDHPDGDFSDWADHFVAEVVSLTIQLHVQ